MDYKSYNDYELIYQIRENDEDSYNILFTKYSFLVNKLAYEYYCVNKNFGIELEDLTQEGFYGLSLALKEYDSENALFYTYAMLCIRREIERYLKYQKRNKHLILSNAISLSTPIDGDNELFLEDVISMSWSLEDSVISDISYYDLLLFKYELKFEDSLVFELKINKFSNKEISLLLDIGYGEVDNRLRRIRKKLMNKI